MDAIFQECGNMDWQDCVEKRFVKDISLDKNLIASLVLSSNNKRKSSQLLPLTNITASSKISLNYDALRELLEALAIKHHFKVYNHACYTAFLKQIVKEYELANSFDKLRKIRNGINYYGHSIEQKEAKQILLDINHIIEKIENLLQK